MTTAEKFYNRIITSSHVLGPIFSYPLFAIFYYYLWQFSFIITFGNMYNLPWIFGYGSLGFMTSIWIGWYVSLIPVLIVIALNVWVLFRFLVHPPVSLRRLGLVCGIGIGSAFPALLLVGGIVFIFPSLVLNPLYSLNSFLYQYPILLLVGIPIFPIFVAYYFFVLSGAVTEKHRSYFGQFIQNPFFWVLLITFYALFFLSLYHLGMQLFIEVNDFPVFQSQPLAFTSLPIALLLPIFPLMFVIFWVRSYGKSDFNS